MKWSFLLFFSGKQCVQVIQLHNAIDYAVNFTAFLVEEWRIKSPFEYLKRELQAIRDIDIPIIINVHQNEDAREEKLKQFIGDWWGLRNFSGKVVVYSR